MIEPLAAIQAAGLEAVLPARNPVAAPAQNPATTFADMLRQGIETTNAKVSEADRLITAYTLDTSIPAHQVTFALEEARLSLELMIQVRNRLLEGFQQLVNMQV